MEIKYTKQFLSKLEDIFSEAGLVLRYEKGNFKSGYCILKETGMVIVNKYYSLDGKINCLLEIVKQVEINPSELKERSQKLYSEIVETNTAS